MSHDLVSHDLVSHDLVSHDLVSDDLVSDDLVTGPRQTPTYYERDIFFSSGYNAEAGESFDRIVKVDIKFDRERSAARRSLDELFGCFPISKFD